jgi:hypothetical protein
MSRLQSDFNGATDFLGVLSLGSVVLSSILLVTPVKAVGYIGIGGGLGTFTVSVITRKKSLKVAEEYFSQLSADHQAELTVQKEKVVSLGEALAESNKKFSLSEASNKERASTISGLENQVESLVVQNQSQQQLVENITGELDRLIAVARTAIEESLDEWATRLSALVMTKKEQYPKLAERLNSLLDEGNRLLDEYASKLEQTPSKWDSLADLLSLYYCLNDDLVNVKVRAIQAIAKLTNQETQLELQEVNEILEEWQTANLVPRDKLEHIIRNYQSALNEFRMDFSKRFDTTHQFALALERQSQDDDKFVQGILGKMNELEQKIHQLSKPITYPGATRTDMRIANVIIAYFERLGIILDFRG